MRGGVRKVGEYLATNEDCRGEEQPNWMYRQAGMSEIAIGE